MLHDSRNQVIYKNHSIQQIREVLDNRNIEICTKNNRIHIQINWICSNKEVCVTQINTKKKHLLYYYEFCRMIKIGK